jgi:long-chain acyl-CoA synthetase
LLDGVEARIGDNQELLVRGPGVMRGYWKREADTAQAFVDGWLRTGDQAALEGGRLRILGRVKEIIVTSTGEKIAPADLEQAITADPLFDQAWAFGDGRPCVACIVVLNAKQWQGFASSLGLDPSAPASLAEPAALKEAMRRIERLTHAFPRHGQPRKVLLTLEPWTLENSLMTPTLKLKRRNLQARFGAAIDALYAAVTR